MRLSGSLALQMLLRIKTELRVSNVYEVLPLPVLFRHQLHTDFTSSIKGRRLSRLVCKWWFLIALDVDINHQKIVGVGSLDHRVEGLVLVSSQLEARFVGSVRLFGELSRARFELVGVHERIGYG